MQKKYLGFRTFRHMDVLLLGRLKISGYIHKLEEYSCLFILLFFPMLSFSQMNGYEWTKVVDSAAWSPRDSQGEVVYDNHMWIFGGWEDSFKPPPRDVWKSSDGKNWQRVTEKAPWTHSDLPMTTVFRDRMWFMGGWENGRLENRGAGNQVWSSKNGKDWILENNEAQWSARCAGAVVVFRDKIWMLGGTTDYYYSNDSSLLNDVWYSEDGQHWHLATADAGWQPRAFHQAVVLNERIYVMGGGNYDPEYFGLNDVWSSEDGIHWQKETESAPWHERIWFSSVAWEDKIWVIGGWSGNPYKNWKDIWYSSDGAKWFEIPAKNIPWKERHEHSAFVFKEQLWIAGGMTPPLVSDVWLWEKLK